MTDTLEPVAAANEEVDQEQLAQQLLAQAKEQGVELVGPDGLLNQLTKRVLETALEEEMSEHLGYDKHDPVGRNLGNSRNGVRSKTVLTEIGPVEIDLPRDIEASFTPQIVKKRQRRLTGVDEIVLSLTARGLTTGEIAAHFAEVYGASVSKETVSKITDKVIEEMTEWCNRPLDPGRIPLVVANPGMRDSDAKVCAKQDAGGGQAPLLRVDQAGLVRRVGGRAGRGVVELRVAVVHRRWPGELRRDVDQSALSVPRRSDRDRRRSRAGRAGQADCGADRQVPPNRLPRAGPEPEGRRTLSAVVRAQSGAPAPPPSQATQVRRRGRATRGRGRQARQALVAGPDQPLAAATIPPPQRLACLRRDHL